MQQSTYDFLRDFLVRHSGLALSEQKRYLVETRLVKIVRDYELADINAVVAELRKNEKSKLAQDVIESMTTNETMFYRDKHPFESLAEHIAPEMLERHRQLRVWSAACSRGQEPYTIAMVLDKLMPDSLRRCRIVGTDLDEVALRYADAGVYTQMEVQRGLGVRDLVQYFEQDNVNWKVHNKLRGMVKFQKLNLIDDASVASIRGEGEFHVVFCRNVLIYFSPEERCRVIDRISKRMVVGGYLFTGATEVIGQTKSEWAPVKKGQSRLWQLLKSA
ncbi:MAG: protein-glutamate O-methyltransferase CheR [Zetaproteobacteria bacterium]|nr:protein-glutamate O-methyltransferase CheR [Zetaproteobacteria bacterium]